MSELKTRVKDSSFAAFIDSVDDKVQRADARALVDMMRDATGAEPKMWGSGSVTKQPLSRPRRTAA